MKKKIALCLAALLLFAAVFCAGCGKYRSHYKAVGFVHSNSASSADMSFFEFEGTMAFRLKNEGGGSLRYTAALETGSAALYYDCGGEKIRLCTVHPGEEINATESLPETGAVYVIVETDEKCGNGKIGFSIEG